MAEQENPKSKIERIEAALLEVGNLISKQPPNEGAPVKVNSNMIEKKKSTKRLAVDHDKSKTNDKKKKALTEDYKSMVGHQITTKKKQPAILCGSMLIAKFLNQEGEKGKAVVVEENEENELQQVEFEKETIVEDQSLNEELNHEITAEEGNNFNLIYMLWF